MMPCPDFRIIPNAIVRSKGDRKTYVGDQLSQGRDFSGLFYKLAFEKGLLSNWEAEKVIWDQVFNHSLDIETTESSLILTEPLFNLPNIQTSYDQMIFEEYEFQSYCRTVSPMLAMRNDTSALDLGAMAAVCSLIVETGYSFTHVVPIVNGEIIWSAVRRINVGGKLLTNHLKELVSFRQWNMMDQTYVMNQVKETCCFVSNNFDTDLETCKVSSRRNPIVQEYVLPDFSTKKSGYVRKRTKQQQDDEDEDQVLYMNNERFTVPEILFRPSDIGMQQAGLTETIIASVSAVEPSLQGPLYANIVLIGGNVLFTGLKERLLKELQEAVDERFIVRIATPSSPITYAWQGAKRWANEDPSNLARASVTRQEYEEYGARICEERFGTMS